ncbi:MAG TPA: CoB--CoM heterodisulfide reductase iron-sulfur subunit B family protein [Candidatus Brocadiia bacterium]|nr:CoB--CoM heterodisulfide reductase iron-sulfur subunit B family protein [Candidatus Brocadiia bacterium]
MRYAFFPGCSMEATAWDFGKSARALFKALDIRLEEIPGWVCCGSTPAHSSSEGLALALPALNLQKAGAMGAPVMTACAACYSRLRAANHRIQNDPESRKRAEQLTEKPYDGGVAVHHILDVLVNHVGRDVISSRIKRPLRGLRIACYYGCLLSRPPGIVAYDDPEHPSCMDGLLELAGAETVQWPFKTECCGASLAITNNDVVNRLVHRILSMAALAGANCVAVACPLCQMNLDLRQDDARKAHGDFPTLPVLYVTQLLGIALGLSEKDVGLEALTVGADKLLAGAAR